MLHETAGAQRDKWEENAEKLLKSHRLVRAAWQHVGAQYVGKPDSANQLAATLTCLTPAIVTKAAAEIPPASVLFMPDDFLLPYFDLERLTPFIEVLDELREYAAIDANKQDDRGMPLCEKALAQIKSIAHDTLQLIRDAEEIEWKTSELKKSLPFKCEIVGGYSGLHGTNTANRWIRLPCAPFYGLELVVGDQILRIKRYKPNGFVQISWNADTNEWIFYVDDRGDAGFDDMNFVQIRKWYEDHGWDVLDVEDYDAEDAAKLAADEQETDE